MGNHLSSDDEDNDSAERKPEKTVPTSPWALPPDETQLPGDAVHMSRSDGSGSRRSLTSTPSPIPELVEHRSWDSGDEGEQRLPGFGGLAIQTLHLSKSATYIDVDRGATVTPKNTTPKFFRHKSGLPLPPKKKHK